MKSKELDSGAAGTATRIVQACDLASALSPDHADNFPDVFATAGMVALMEMAAARAIASVVEEGELTAGVSINVTHTAATPPGATVRAHARFLGREGKFYRFEVFAEDEAGEIGRGRSTTARSSSTGGCWKERKNVGDKKGALVRPSS
jgi:fluoroacetyl-CoA thioesterase